MAEFKTKDGRVFLVRSCDEDPCVVIEEIGKDPGDDPDPLQEIHIPADLARLIGHCIASTGAQITQHED